MASFREKKGKWEYIVSAGLDPVTKKYIKITKSGFRTKTEARNEARRVEEELKQGTYIKESKTTFGDLLDVWIKHYEKRAKVSSVRARSIAAKQLLKEWEHYPISSITMSMYQQHLDNLSKNVSPNYLDSIHTTGRMIFTHAEKLKLITNNPTKHFEKPRMVKDEVIEEVDVLENFLEREELQEFLLLVKNEGLRGDLVIFATLAYSGLRIGELLALKESDIDFKTNVVRVSKTYYNPKNNKREYSLLTPKTSGSLRTIELDPFVIGLLKSHIKQIKEEKLKNRMIYHDKGFVFVDVQGYPMPIKMVAIRLQRLMKKMNTTKHITPHSFRHTNISLLIEAQVPIGEIQRRVGHNSIETTMNIYAHMTKQTKDQAANLFSSHLSSLTDKLQN
ncbi:tyrosine-type recombinase/integrase [Sporosarcina jeotgali]|uniref:Tyrosine-type recombinase/integrase n=1 Tax=Sporosarcina jeotgali TaxID=3020056 RepID=A0ABZ0KX42_9BACL|nr:tyrosine-type recombinase/integrase [Sporosarcina sp. B2O-1]WOV83922.1 tyrosine-type recombinase/integrase [Sporosarcina sp. B2O-1]